MQNKCGWLFGKIKTKPLADGRSPHFSPGGPSMCSFRLHNHIWSGFSLFLFIFNKINFWMQQLRSKFVGKDVFPSLGSPPLFCHWDELSVAGCQGMGGLICLERGSAAFVSSGLNLSPSPTQLQRCLQVKKLSFFHMPTDSGRGSTLKQHGALRKGGLVGVHCGMTQNLLQVWIVLL